MTNKLIFAPIPLLLGGWMFTSSFSTNTIQQSATPYSTQQQTVEVEMPEPAKSFLRFGGSAIAIFGTSSLVFWELASKKRDRNRPQLLLPAGENFIPNTGYFSNNSQPISDIQSDGLKRSPSGDRKHGIPYKQEQLSDEESKQPNNFKAPKQTPNFYQTGGFPLNLPNEKIDAVSQFQAQANSEDKYASVRSLVYENTVGIVGKEKGSGKTSKLGYLIAEHIKLGHLVWMVNPFAKGQHWKGIKVFGRGYNFLEATNAIREFTRIAFWRIAEAGDETKEYEPFEDYHLNLALDEMSNYSSEIDAIDSTVMPKFWEAVVQFLRQANMSVSFASHGDTQAMLGGAKALAGKSETIKDAIVWLYAQAITDRNIEGNKRCAGWGYLIRPDGGDRQKQRIDIPNWMQGPPATRLDGKDKYNYIELAQKYCPQFLYLPPSKQNLIEDTPIDTEQFRQKLIEQEDIWGLEDEN
ncbi:hypothetical protein [Calothrix sp. PCC 6303]|uniref:hypothetical protein n=1 Tax=Calothrix sp. PCC 6303 TaxID=1170562 RepID=UPI0002A05485|nr:hypothetical protein [Calothrix sp. PCC 6303]AFZ01334.1 hypothetical protein Cal6303_2318 [Calothrix sp. PCC 6303]